MRVRDCNLSRKAQPSSDFHHQTVHPEPEFPARFALLLIPVLARTQIGLRFEEFGKMRGVIKV